MRSRKIDLLQILIEPALRKQRILRREFLRQQRHLREFRRTHGQDVVSAQSLIRPEKFLNLRRDLVNGCRLAFHHVLIKLRRTPHRLARIVDDEIQTVASGQQLPAEGFDAWRVPQIEPEDFQPAAPVVEIRFAGITRGGVARKSRGDNERRAGTQKFDARLIADLDAAAGQQRHSATQVRRFGSLQEVEFGARRAKLIVEMMNCRIRLLADIAMLRLGGLAKIRIFHIALFEVGGGKTFGVVKKAWLRSFRIPVCASVTSSRSVFRAL